MHNILAEQAGVISRRQLIDLGLVHHDVRRLVRQRDLVPLVRGVYVNHTGPPSWKQKAWAGVLRYWPAALSHASALHVDSSYGRPPALVEVAVDRSRSLTPTRGIRLHRMANFDARVHWSGGPPRVRLEEALLDVATSKGPVEAIATLADAVQARRTTARRLLAAMDDRHRLPHREFLAGVLLDVERGTGSVLEHLYLTRVERPHGLPTGERQARVGTAYHDVLYAECSQVVELDGRLFHDGAVRREADLERDVVAAVQGLATVRLGWGHVVSRPCRTARQIATLLRARGWAGRPVRCPECA